PTRWPDWSPIPAMPSAWDKTVAGTSRRISHWPHSERASRLLFRTWLPDRAHDNVRARRRRQCQPARRNRARTRSTLRVARYCFERALSRTEGKLRTSERRARCSWIPFRGEAQDVQDGREERSGAERDLALRLDGKDAVLERSQQRQHVRGRCLFALKGRRVQF